MKSVTFPRDVVKIRVYHRSFVTLFCKRGKPTKYDNWKKRVEINVFCEA